MSACDMIRPPMNSRGGQIATGDRLQFAHELFDRHAEEVYHYVLAWTGDQASAVDLTTMVLRTAVARMDQLAEGADAAELEMRLIALVRAAVTRWRARRPSSARRRRCPRSRCRCSRRSASSTTTGARS